MRFWFSGPRFMGVRPGISFSPNDFRQSQGPHRHNGAGERIEGSFVYVVRGDHNMTKIGVTTNPAARLAQLRTGSAFPIEYAFIGVTPGTGYDIEQEAHTLLDKHRCAGEWFDVSPELAISAIMGAAGKLGQPMRAIDLSTASMVLDIAANGGDIQPTQSESSFWFGQTAKRTATAFWLWLLMTTAANSMLGGPETMPDWMAVVGLGVFPYVSYQLAKRFYPVTA